MSTLKVLVVDDDVNIQELLRLYFEKDGYVVLTESDGSHVQDCVHRFAPDVVILDLMLPGKNGFDVLRDLRKQTDIPVIMLTARGETLDKVVGLELGADDYVPKPFEPKELLARVKAVLRRTRPTASMRYADEQNRDQIQLDRLILDRAGYSVILDGQEIVMPPKEQELLYFMASHPNRVFTREQILENIWGYDFFGDTRTVDVHVKRIREKIDTIDRPLWRLKTVWGVGYKFEIDEDLSR